MTKDKQCTCHKFDPNDHPKFMAWLKQCPVSYEEDYEIVDETRLRACYCFIFPKPNEDS